MINYYALLTSKDTSWMADDSPFRFPRSFRNIPFIHCELRNFKRGSLKKLVKPVVENPQLYIPSDTGKKRIIFSQASSMPGSVRAKFNWKMQRCIDTWHRQAKELGCEHPQPYLRLCDDALAELFSL
jgi:hypothetical protein